MTNKKYLPTLHNTYHTEILRTNDNKSKYRKTKNLNSTKKGIDQIKLNKYTDKTTLKQKKSPKAPTHTTANKTEHSTNSQLNDPNYCNMITLNTTKK